MTSYKDLNREIQREEIAGLSYMFWARITALGLLAIWVASTIPVGRSAAYLVAIITFAILGAPPYFLARADRARTPIVALFLLIDAATLTYILIVPPSFYVEGWTAQLNMRLPNFLFMGIFLVGMALSYSPWLVIWAGAASIVAWSVGFLWVACLPGTVTSSSRDALDRGLSASAVIDKFLDPRTVSLTTWEVQIVFLLLVTAILTLTVWRSRELVRRQVIAEAGRAVLSRYFSPNIVREISGNADALDRPKVQNAAIIFADMVGFTTISERLPPSDLVALLREFHGRLARVVFDHDGTVDKYIGDAIMVHFGTPSPRSDDAARALSCAQAMLAEIEMWTSERISRGEAAIKIGIGLHYGEVVVGNIGDSRRLEYTVLGDAVNVASRLERLTRHTGAVLIASDDLIGAIRKSGADPNSIIKKLLPEKTRTVRGRRQPVALWTLAVSAERTSGIG